VSEGDPDQVFDRLPTGRASGPAGRGGGSTGFQTMTITRRTLHSLVRLVVAGDFPGVIRRICRRIRYRRPAPVDYRAWREQHVDPLPGDRSLFAIQVGVDPAAITIAFVLDSLKGAESTIASVADQFDPSWSLHLPAGQSSNRTEVSHRSPGEDPCTWVVALEAGDVVEPTTVAALRRTTTDVHRIIYTDYDHLNTRGDRATPFFRCGPNFDLLLGHDYLSRFAAVRADSPRAGESTREVALRLLDEEPESVLHLPYVLFGRRPGATRSQPDERQPRHLLPQPPPLVSVVIPTKDRGRMLERCLRGLFEETDYPTFEVILIDHESIEKRARSVIDRLALREDCTVVRYEGKFNYAAMMNLAAEKARGSFLCLLNNDTRPLEPGWLRAMVAQACRPGIGVVGAHLLFPNGTIQHAGIHPGLGGLMGHGHKNVDGDDPGYFGRLRVAHQVAAVTGACLVTARQTWLEVGGMDEEHFAVAYNDVDYCLRLRELGLRSVVTPEARLTHHESVSRGYDDDPTRRVRLDAELKAIRERWGDELTVDPAYNPNLDLVGGGFRIDARPRTPHLRTLLFP